MKMAFRVLAAMLFGIALVNAAAASVRTVGPSADCGYHDLQSALDKVQDGDEIHVVTGGFGNLHLETHDRVLAMIGGYTNCGDAQSSGTQTQLSGRGGGDSILLIDGSANVTLRYLNFANTTLDDSDSGTHGAGINYRGHGALLLDHVGIVFNTASYGAGLNVSADGPADIFISQGTTIAYNTAYRQGGGVNIEGEAHLYMLQPQTLIMYNVAGSKTSGYGGGLQINAPAFAEIGSPSTGDLGAVSHNVSAYGGGIAVQPNAILRLVSSDNTNPVSVSDNQAFKTGGAIYAAADNNHGEGNVCGHVFHMDRNIAQNGSAIYSDSTDGDLAMDIELRRPQYRCVPIKAAVSECPQGAPCNTINDNVATQAGAATILIQTLAGIEANAFEIRRNQAAHAIRWISGPYSSLENCLIADNLLTDDVLNYDVYDNSYAMYIAGCTIASNTLNDGAPMIDTSGHLKMYQSILWQPPHTLVYAHGNGVVTGQGLVVNDAASFPTVGGVTQVFAPGFVEPGADYHLRADSPAVDYLLPNLTAESVTLDGYPRGKSIKASNSSTPYDVGAYERQRVPAQTFPFVESFDELDPTGLELPTGWSSGSSGANPGWFVTTDADRHTGYAMHTSDPGGAGQSVLISPAFAGSPLLIFRHKFQLEPTYDVALLEISADGSNYQDILDAGGRFVNGAYNMLMSLGNPPNPIQRVGKPVWSGDSGAQPYSTVKIVLPPASPGQRRQLRWHVGSDGSGTHPGYWLDSIELVPDDIFIDSAGG